MKLQPRYVPVIIRTLIILTGFTTKDYLFRIHDLTDITGEECDNKVVQ